MNQCTLCKQTCLPGYRVIDIAKNKVVTEYYLCGSCGSVYLESMFTKSSPKLPTTGKHVSVSVISSAAELLALLLDKTDPMVPATQRSTHSPCPKCGHTLADLQTNGRFGCAYCYKHFDNIIVDIVDFAQNGLKNHTGKVPKNFKTIGKEPKPDETLKMVKLRLAYAIEHEHFEEAAKLRDRLKDLES